MSKKPQAGQTIQETSQSRKPALRGRRSIIQAAGAVAASAVVAPMLMPRSAYAKYPDRPITVIVPYAAGGGTDAAGRAIAMALEERLGKPVNVVNRGGGNAVVGHQAIASAKPDGYTIGIVSSEISMLHWLGLTKLTHADYTPLGLINAEWAGVQVAADSRFKTLRELLDAIRNEPPGSVKGSGTGVGASWHVALAGLLLDQGIDPARLVWVPSQGAAPGLVDMIAGGVQVVPCSVPEARALMEAGRVRGLAIMGPERHALFKDVPTVKEAIGSGYTDAAWRSVGAPKGLPAEVTDVLADALKHAYDSKFYQDFLVKNGMGPKWMPAAELRQFMVAHDATMGNTLEKLGMKKG
jgi:tripartite-type tricarboxylate transporter receptor subunit TctC